MSNNYNVSFGSVVPVRVFKNGVLQSNEQEIRKGLVLLRESLSGIDDRFGDRDYYVMKRFAAKDPEYSLDRGLDADYYFADKKTLKKDRLSKYFRHFIEPDGRAYFITGYNAAKLEDLGHSIGVARRDGGDVKSARHNFGEALKNIVYKQEYRLRENFIEKSKIKHGRPVVLDIDLFSLSPQETVLESIKFSTMA